MTKGQYEVLEKTMVDGKLHHCRLITRMIYFPKVNPAYVRCMNRRIPVTLVGKRWTYWLQWSILNPKTGVKTL